MYVTREQLKAFLSDDLVRQALDDNGDGQIDEPAWDAVVAAVDNAIEGPISRRYPVPLPAPFPPVVRDGAVILACEALYQRRGTPPDQNPFTGRANTVRKTLDAIGKGEEALTADSLHKNPPVTIIDEQSRLGPTGRMLN